MDQAARSPSSGTSGRELILRARPENPDTVDLDTLQVLYRKYRERYGWQTPEYLGFCGRLVERSMERGTTRETMSQEFYAVEKLDPGSDFRVTAGAIAEKAGKTIDGYLPWALKQTEGPERPSADVVRFLTVMLGDGILSDWKFTIGEEYTRRYHERLVPNGFETQSRDLSQTEIDVRLRSIGARAAGR